MWQLQKASMRHKCAQMDNLCMYPTEFKKFRLKFNNKIYAVQLCPYVHVMYIPYQFCPTFAPTQNFGIENEKRYVF